MQCADLATAFSYHVMVEFLSFTFVAAPLLCLAWNLTSNIRFFLISLAIIATLHFLSVYFVTMPTLNTIDGMENVISSRSELALHFALLGPSMLIDSLLTVLTPIPNPTREDIAFGASVAVTSFLLAGIAWFVRGELIETADLPPAPTTAGVQAEPVRSESGPATISDGDGESVGSSAKYRLKKVAIILWPFAPLLLVPLWEGWGLMLATSPLGMIWFIVGIGFAKHYIAGRGMRGFLLFLNVSLLASSLLFWGALIFGPGNMRF